MELQTISQISKQFGVSTRTLRYYEQIGLIQSTKKEDFTYRTYDENTIDRLRQIIVLRKLRIPLRQIADILRNEDTTVVIQAFSQNLAELEDEITALSTIRNVIQTLLRRLHLQNDMLLLLDDESLLDIVDSLTISKINFKEEKTMEDLNKANEKLNRLTDRDVRIAYLPPATVASIHCMGEQGKAEAKTGTLCGEFVDKTELWKIKPDMRHFGFDHMRGKDHGYERWLTIPKDMEVAPPWEKKEFPGGMYAGYSIWFNDFIQSPMETWGQLREWLGNHAEYEVASGLQCFEEHLNDMRYFIWPDQNADQQLDLLIPIQRKTS